MSSITKHYRLWFRIMFVVSLLLNICPLGVYTVKALLEADLTHEKVALTMTVFVVLIMTIICIANKIVLRSRLWIVLIGIYLCLDYIMTPLIIIAVCQVLDELVACPIKKYCKTRLVINKQIDKRS